MCDVFVGRERELDALERMWQRDSFQMMVVLGRRRVGKTALLDEFAKGRRTLYFTARQQTTASNLRDFTRALMRFLSMPEGMPAFPDWGSAIDFLVREAGRIGERFLFVFDEFPYAAMADGSLPSVMQIAIDHGFKDLDAMLVLCGSNEGFMESEVLGYKSPLYGRRTGQIRLKPFDAFDTRRMLGGVPAEDAVAYYAAFGGTPYYLRQVRPERGFERNVEDLMLDASGLLYEEPMMLLRQELRDPATYSSVLDAVGAGRTRQSEIADHAGVSPATAVSKYLGVLADLGLVERLVPFGEDPRRSRKGLWKIRDPFFAFWHRFVSPNVPAIENGNTAAAARGVFGPALDTYVGQRFEDVCMQWVVRANGTDRLPLLATKFGKWWGNDPRKREQTDIDLVAADPETGDILLGECKWRNRFDETGAVEALLGREGLVKGYEHTRFALFTKRSVSDTTRDKYRDRVTFVSADEMYGAVD